MIIQNLPENINRILDIGCGSTPWLLYLKPEKLQRLEVLVMDKVQYKHLKIFPFKFIVADADGNYLPFIDNYFDIVTAVALIEHLKNYQNFVKEVYRVLKPGGYFIFTTPDPSAKPILEFLSFKLHLISRKAIEDHKHYFDEREIKELLETAGFNINDLKKFEFGLNIFVKAKK